MIDPFLSPAGTPRSAPVRIPWAMFAIVILAFAVAIPWAATPAVADSYEPNDSPEQAHTLTNGVPLESWISYRDDSVDLDWYKFEATVTGAVTITLASIPPGTDYELALFDEEGRELETSENSDNADELIEYELTSMGWYYVLVYPYWGFSDTDSYILTATWPGGTPPQPPAVTVTRPNGGETWTVGTTEAITWTATDPDTPDDQLQIAIEYSTNNGSSWNPIASGEANDGTYSWTVPNAPTTQGRVRVTASDGALQGSDTSNSSFSIIPPGGGGENTLAVGSTTGPSGTNATVSLQLDNEGVVKALQTDVVFNPAVVEFVSGSVTGRAAGMTFGASVIEGNRVRVVIYTAGAGTIAPGTGAISDLVFRLIGASGTSTALTPTATVLADPDSQPLGVTEVAGSITVTAPQTQPPVVTVTRPNGGETWTAGTSEAITWTATDPDTPDDQLQIAIDYSTNNGSSWSPIASGEANDGTYSWTVPNTPTLQCRVRITASDGALQTTAASAGAFSIVSAPTGIHALWVGQGQGGTGTRVNVPLNLANEDAVKGVQTDVQFNPQVVSFHSIEPDPRIGTMSAAASVVGGNRVRVVLYYSDANILAPGSGAVASLSFTLMGGSGTSTALTPVNSILSDADGQAMPVTESAGSINIAGEGSFAVQVFALKNPGHTRILQVFASASHPFAEAPAVTAGGTPVTMTQIPGRNVYQGRVLVNAATSSVTIEATGTDGATNATAETIVTF